MLVGTAKPEELAAGAAHVAEFAAEPVVLEDVEVFQAQFEMRADSRECLLPPGLHPTNPATLVVLAWRCPGGPWGAFSLCQVRVGCRSGVRTRGLVVGCACDSDPAAKALAASWGFAARPGRIALARRYDGLSLDVSIDGEGALALEALDPDPLGSGDVQYTGTLTLAHTTRGLRLVQVEPSYATSRVERLTAHQTHFDGERWGQPALRPYHPISASIALATITLPPVRFLCRPDVLAFQGTESVD